LGDSGVAGEGRQRGPRGGVGGGEALGCRQALVVYCRPAHCGQEGSKSLESKRYICGGTLDILKAFFGETLKIKTPIQCGTYKKCWPHKGAASFHVQEISPEPHCVFFLQTQCHFYIFYFHPMLKCNTPNELIENL